LLSSFTATNLAEKSALKLTVALAWRYRHVVTLSTDSRKPSASYRSWLPRLSSAVMVDLRLWMLGFGLLIGLAFPFVVVLLGVPRDIALRPSFFAATLIAGLVVAEVNHLLAHAVVGVRLRSLAGGMQRVEESLLEASSSGDWAGCDPNACMVPVDSTDELGQVAASFNRLVAGLSTSHQVSDGIKSLSKALAAHLELGSLADAMLGELSMRTGCDAAGVLVVSNGRVEVVGSSGIRDSEQLASAQTVLTALRTAQPTVLHLPADVVVSGSLADFIPQEVQVLPVLYGVVPVGVLVVAFAQPSSPEAGAVLNATLPGLAVALNNSLNHEDLQRVAALDPLTGVYNRRFGLQRLTEEVRPLDSIRRPPGRADARPRPLQGRQRHLRAPGRRPGTTNRGAGGAADPARGGRAPALRRRGVHHRPARSRA
jgi:two-component system cell cycle response regulator